MRRVADFSMWCVLRVFGLYALTLALSYAAIVIEMETSAVPQSERIPFMATSLAFFAGTLVLIPSTTPRWIREIDSIFKALVTILALICLTLAILVGLYRILPLAIPEITNAFNTVFAAVVVFLLAIGIWMAGYLGATARDYRPRSRALMASTTPGDEFDPRMQH